MAAFGDGGRAWSGAAEPCACGSGMVQSGCLVVWLSLDRVLCGGWYSTVGRGGVGLGIWNRYKYEYLGSPQLGYQCYRYR